MIKFNRYLSKLVKIRRIKCKVVYIYLYNIITLFTHKNLKIRCKIPNRFEICLYIYQKLKHININNNNDNNNNNNNNNK